MHGDANILGPRFGQHTENDLLGEFLFLELEERIAIERDKTYHLLDVNRKAGFSSVRSWRHTFL